MATPKGGRGKTAPYETTHVRVPVPLKPKLEKMIEEYREFVISGIQPESETHPNRPHSVSMTTVEEAKGIAKDILKSKKGAKESLAKLLTALYGGNITVKDLT